LSQSDRVEAEQYKHQVVPEKINPISLWLKLFALIREALNKTGK
jgi:hypothetical protein